MEVVRFNCCLTGLNTMCDAAEGLLDVFGRSKRVTLFKSSENQELVRVGSSHKQSWKVTAGKVVLWIGSLFTLPLLALMIKACSRAFNNKRIKQAIETSECITLPCPIEKKVMLLPQKVKKLNQGVPPTELGFKTVDEALKYFEKYKKDVTTLNLREYGNNVEDKHLLMITHNFSSLEKLTVHSTVATAEGFKGLQNLTSLKSLILHGCGLSNENMDMIGNMDHLVELDFSYSSFELNAYPSFSKMINLQTLNLDGHDKLGNDSLHELFSLPSLEALSLKWCKGFDMSVFHKLGDDNPSKIRKLNLQITNYKAKNKTLEAFKTFKHLQTVMIGGGGLGESAKSKSKEFFAKHLPEVVLADV